MSDEPNTPLEASGPEGQSGSDSPDADSPDRRAWMVVGALAVVVIILGVWLWAASGDDTEDIAGTGDASSTSNTTTSTTTEETAESTASTTTEDEGTSTTESTLPDENPGGITVPEGASQSPVSVPAGSDTTRTGITGVRTARHEGFDRVVFEFDGALPGYEVGYTEKPVREDGSGKEVSVDGTHVVTVRMTPASGVRITDGGYEEIYTGPDRVPGEGATVTEIVEAGDFEAQATWAVGLADKVDFAVSTLESPSRLVVDFVNH